MSNFTDAERLDAIGELGLCLVAHDIFEDGKWHRFWMCQASMEAEQGVASRDIRSAIDNAVMLIQASESSKH